MRCVSSRLLEVAAAATENGWGRSKGQGARGLMHIAQTGTMDVPGTSTACIALMMLGRTLQVANLGDSGFRVFRDGRCLFSSEVGAIASGSGAALHPCTAASPC